MNKEYCYKIKRNWLKLERLKEFGFDMFIDEQTEEVYWAKKVVLNPKSSIATFLKEQIELIYKRGDENTKKDIESEGYEFDKEGCLVINTKFVSGLSGELCVSVNYGDEDRGCLFINLDGMEWHSTKTLDECVFNDIVNLSLKNVIYKKRMYLEKMENA